MTEADCIEQYIAGAPSRTQAALEVIRAQITELYPEATPHISHRAPLYKLDGRPLGGFYAATNHCALYVWSGTVLSSLGSLLDGYNTAQSTIRFQPEAPIPAAIIKAVFTARATEIRTPPEGLQPNITDGSGSI
jgi:uncharacterized protein YdhG (YjbR/CyaY superfamily)